MDNPHDVENAFRGSAIDQLSANGQIHKLSVLFIPAPDDMGLRS